MEQNQTFANSASPQQNYNMYNNVYQDFYAQQYQSMLPQSGYFNFYNPYYAAQYSQYATNTNQMNYYKPIASPESSTTENRSYENLLTPNSSYTASQNSSSGDSQQSTPTLPSASKVFFPTPSSDNEYEHSDKKAPLQQISPVSYPKDDEESKVDNSKAQSQSKRRTRTQFTKAQLEALETMFNKNHYPDVQQVDRMSEKLGLAIERISVWFQNRRAKYKKVKKPSMHANDDDISNQFDEIENSNSVMSSGKMIASPLVVPQYGYNPAFCYSHQTFSN